MVYASRRRARRWGGALASLIFLHMDKTDPRVSSAADRLIILKPSPDDGDFLGYYLASLGLFQYDGPAGPKWKQWSGQLRDALRGRQGIDGGWTVKGEAIAHTALGGLTLQICYRYATVFGVGGGENPLPLAPAPRVRIYFPDTAFWAPELVTDGRGEAHFKFRAPDEITTTRVTARGVTKEGEVGQAVVRLETRQPFFVKLRSPEFAVLGDEFEIRADLFNYTKTALAVTARLEGSPVEHSLTVPAERPASASWRVSASNPAGLRLSVIAKAGPYADAVERVVPVRRPGLERWVALSGKGETGGKFAFNAPYGVADLVLKVQPRIGNLSRLLEALRYLNDYPYGCTEQTMAKLVPNLLTAEVLGKLGIRAEKFNPAFGSMMKAGIDRLLSLQQPSGGWGWFEKDNEDPFMTAYAVHGLSECDRLGYRVDAVALERGRKRLSALVRQEKNPDRLAYMAWVSGEGIDRLLPETGRLSPYATALLALALHKLGRPEAVEAARRLADGAKGDHWEMPKWFYKWEDPSIETTAYAIRALATVDPGNGLIPRAVGWLLSKREGGRWRSTKDTAAAIAALLKAESLEALARAVGVDPASGAARPPLPTRVTVRLDTGSSREFLVDLNDPIRGRFEAHFEGVNPGPRAIAFESGDGRSDFKFDLDLAMRVFDEGSGGGSRGDLTVRVEYDRPLESLRLGDEVAATVTVSSPEPVDFVMVLSPIPAGAEVVRGSGEGEFAGFEGRYDKAVFFLRSLGPEPRVLRYRIRCAFAGRFTVPPAWAGVMYNEDVCGGGEILAARIGH